MFLIMTLFVQMLTLRSVARWQIPVWTLDWSASTDYRGAWYNPQVPASQLHNCPMQGECRQSKLLLSNLQKTAVRQLLQSFKETIPKPKEE